ncbi:DNA primase [Candidatus Endobugula sertula]|uniref:DNA primase n=1 Tax=Candidatus Endobugula sertula TaxID=62101 RepID=A0A1D2QS81_9GAMM|nr:DNA primase [Candidatus Endobugula sertula]
MARIPNDQIELIKQEVSLLRLAESQGYKLKKQGKDYAVCCPFHEDKTPSCMISPQSNLFNCFGCGTGGSVIDWVMQTQGVGFRHAVEILRDGNPSLAANTKLIKQTTVPKLEAPITENAEDQQVLKQVIDYYHQTLKQSLEALDYLAKRGLDDLELIDHFKLGYANRTLGLRLPQKNRKVGKQLREQLKRIGLYRDTGREHFNGSMVFPIINEQGIVSEVYGRKLLDNLRKGTPKHTYLPGEHLGVFNSQGLLNTDEVILCESIIDALTFWRWGFRHVTASYGTNGFTDEMLHALISNKVKRVLIAYDRDEAGNTAAEKLAPVLQQNGMDAFRILLPKNRDVNEYALQVQPAQKTLALVIRKAEWLGSPSCASMRPGHTVRPEHNGKPPERQLEFTAIQTATIESEVTENNSKPITPEKTVSNESIPAPESNSIDQSASPLPSLAADLAVEKNETEILITLGGESPRPASASHKAIPGQNRVYRVRGLDKNTSVDQLKIQLLVRKGDVFHMDKLDLYSSKQRQVFINQACVELGVKDEVVKKDLGQVLLALEEQQAQQQEASDDNHTIEMNSEERKAAMELLQDENLLDRVLSDFRCAGVVGEETNKLAGYLSCVSRKLDKPLAVIIQSSSAAGKSSLMDSILALMPEEERVQYSAMTGQSLFYMGETNLKNKILAISEEEGASNASYALKLLQSEGEVTIASTGKDDSTGNLVTKEYTVQGPVMLFLTTTAIDIDEELMNRCLVLSVNESREQTQAIHAAQRQKRTLQGLRNKLEKERVISLHRNAQRLLKPLQVINPYADQLTFLDDKTRTRRDHEKYLTLIDSMALLHQYQREIKTVSYAGEAVEYIEVELSDIETANRLAHDILGRTLDELPPQTRKLLKQIQQLVQIECEAQKIEQNQFRFSRKSLRQQMGWTYDQLRVHLERLVNMEYVLVHRGGRGQSFEYELLYDGNSDADQHHAMGLLNMTDLKKTKNKPTTKSLGGKTANVGVPLVGHWGTVDDDEKTLQAMSIKASQESLGSVEKCTSKAV